MSKIRSRIWLLQVAPPHPLELDFQAIPLLSKRSVRLVQLMSHPVQLDLQAIPFFLQLTILCGRYVRIVISHVLHSHVDVIAVKDGKYRVGIQNEGSNQAK